MTRRPPSSTPPVTGDACGRPSARCVITTIWWRGRTKSSRPSRSTSVFVAMVRGMAGPLWGRGRRAPLLRGREDALAQGRGELVAAGEGVGRGRPAHADLVGDRLVTLATSVLPRLEGRDYAGAQAAGLRCATRSRRRRGAVRSATSPLGRRSRGDREGGASSWEDRGEVALGGAGRAGHAGTCREARPPSGTGPLAASAAYAAVEPDSVAGELLAQSGQRLVGGEGALGGRGARTARALVRGGAESDE